MEAPILGKLLRGHYRVIRTLAKGGFGETYIAEDIDLPGNPQCVVKHLKPASADPEFLENARRLFLTEAETLQKLGTHDQIPRLFAYFEEEEEFYLVQELIEGHSLSKELRPTQRWAEQDVCQLLYDVLNILHFIHKSGVIHRDVKPENLIRRHRDHKPVLVDFGTVKQLRTSGLVRSGQTSAATIVVGTPGYMPTEQGRGKPRANSDIYALGIIGIQAVTGLTLDQLQDDQETGEVIWQPWAQVSDELAAILTRMVRYYFRERYQTTLEVLQDLAPLIGQPLPEDDPEQVPTVQLLNPKTAQASETITPKEERLRTVSSPPATTQASSPPPNQTIVSSTPEPRTTEPLAPPPAKSSPVRVPITSAPTKVTSSGLASEQVDRTALLQRIHPPAAKKNLIVLGAGAAVLLLLGTTYAMTRQSQPASQLTSPVTQSLQPDRAEQDRSLLAQAIDVAKDNQTASLEQAIQTLKGISSDSPIYPEAQKQALTWQATLLQSYLRVEVPKQNPKLTSLIKQIQPKVEAIDANKVTIRYDGSGHPDFRSDRGMRVITALFMGRLRGNPKEAVPEKYRDFNQLVVYRQKGDRKATLMAAEWDAFVASKAKEDAIYREIQVTKK